jgi:hypothetical protein
LPQGLVRRKPLRPTSQHFLDPGVPIIQQTHLLEGYAEVAMTLVIIHSR